MASYRPVLRNTGKHIRLTYIADGHKIERSLYTDGKYNFIKLNGRLFEPYQDLKKYWTIDYEF